ncbi:tetratricopeptide repeat protein [Nannocystis radixulma]|uniref:Tetratricopeptide repeat protein n=1 Tax=Nannocystis radixulma TaxID=2995305 RepID=A0ABT5BQ53_9BACT|nr:tetratricopeptide repeat protein [Nannocystis radixulma]MDC0675858.1 tetratricopeptide repeat protein [Nannocystis radixulma]
MSIDLRPPAPDEPAVRSPELLRLVQAARSAPAPVLKVSSDAVFAGFQARRRDSRRLYVGVGLAAAAAVALLWARPSFMSSKTGTLEPVAATTVEAAHTAPAALAASVRVVAEEGPPTVVRGPWQVELADGRYDVTVAAHAGPELLQVDTPGGTVEIAQGRVVIVVAGTRTEAELRTGVATWIASDGARTPLAVPPAADDALDPAAGPSELARHADALLAAGRRDAAIRVLDRLVSAHPDSPPARAALLDLARLLKAAARTDEARCAYALYLERYPAKEQLADEVEGALARLGPGPACAGLRPR